MRSQVSSLSSDGIRQRSETSGEPGWLTELRLGALAAYGKLPAPAYPRTDLSKVDLEGLARKATGGSVRATHAAPKGSGVIVTDLATAAREHPELVRPHLLQSTVLPEEGKVEALHATLWNAGTFMYVPKLSLIHI